MTRPPLPPHRRKVHWTLETGRTGCQRSVGDPQIAPFQTDDVDEVTCGGCLAYLRGELPTRERKVHLAVPLTPALGRSACWRSLDEPGVVGHTTDEENAVTCAGCLGTLSGQTPPSRKIHLLLDDERLACGMRADEPHVGMWMTRDAAEATCRGCRGCRGRSSGGADPVQPHTFGP